MKFVLGAGIALVVWASGCAGGARPAMYAGRYDQEAVAADHEVASRAGAEILRKGGNAVDAAVATSFTLSVVRPYSCGIGGGGFMVIHMAARPGAAATSVTLNYREMAPAAVGPDFYERSPDPNASTRGASAVGIPGTVAGLLHALERYGTMDRATVLAPAIRAAETGFVADAHYVGSARDVIKDLNDHPELKDRFGFFWERFLKSGQVKEGDRIHVPEQAAVLRLIARDGSAGFYDGPVADAIAAAVQKDGGALTRDDLRSFTVVAGEPLRTTFMGREFLMMPPPSSGGIAMAETLGILSRALPPPPVPLSMGTNVAQLRMAVDAANRESRAVRAYRAGPVYLHILAESLKHAFADRSRFLGDPAFTDVPLARLTSPAYLDDRAAAIRLGSVLESGAYGSPDDGEPGGPDDHGTSHFCVIDRWGNSVACTETINTEFGSKLAVEPYGFVLNNEMDDFTTRRGAANAYKLKQSDRNLPAPGKRPLSSMSPTIVLDGRGRVEVIAGASGGPRIITGTTQVILNVLLLNDGAAAAVSRPRMHHQWSPATLLLEPGLYDGEWSALGPWVPGGVTDLPAALRQQGHTVERTAAVGNVQVIARSADGQWEAACDPRKGGKPAGR